jgi:epoxyqueuosine reductase
MTATIATTNGSARALSERVKAHARSLGFEAVGIAPAGAIEADHARYERFIARGYHGEMAWLANNAEARRTASAASILEGAKSVICVASSYKRSAEDEARDAPLTRGIARYARGRDYHNGLRKKLRKLAAFVRTLAKDACARPLCDDAPILERAWAARAGLGFIGKNGLLIVPGCGSFVLLGEVVTTLALTPDAPKKERVRDSCGSCTRCIDVCPTHAIVEPFVLDARRCISYLTIELRGPMPVELRADVGEHLFGCDDCQTVCPFNQTSRGTTTDPRYEPLERWTQTALENLVNDTVLGPGTPLARATPDGIARNAAIVLGNRPRAGGHAALERAAESHPASVVRDAAQWALAQVRAPSGCRVASDPQGSASPK